MELIPVRNVNTFVFCPRLLWLEHVGGDFVDNEHTLEGHFVHRRVDKPGGKLNAPNEEDEPWHTRSLWLSDDDLGITGKIDLVDAEEDGSCFPVDTKKGSPKDKSELWPADRVQLVLQALLMRAQGMRVEKVAAYYNAVRRRVVVELTTEMISEALDALADARKVFEMEPPPPLEDSPQCRGCSLNQICLPDEVNALTLGEDTKIKRVLAPQTDSLPLYVVGGGTRVGVSKNTLIITPRDAEEDIRKVGLDMVSELNLLGGVQFTTQTLQYCLGRDIPVSFFTTGGWYYGSTFSTMSRNVGVRISQYEHHDKELSLRVAQQLISDKVHNCRVLLRRNATNESDTLKRLKMLRREAEKADSKGSLLGYEGDAARRYWSDFSDMVAEVDDAFEMKGRNRRPPKDATNALLSLGYALLTKDCTRALLNVGLDPYLGMYHTTHHGRPSLSLDLMEPFRPLIVDSTVLQVIKRREIQADDVVRTGQGVMLKDRARKTFIGAYERRMADAITHPVFEYRIDYRRVLAVQARLLSRFLTGEIPTLPAFRTR
ncbi:CRISPR-associated endonuclease Cas1 [Microvenator marinus]|uniref:CRISPR-associated endonuclease Cas1 n=1 Tax=Microvenator marinus TaxID=2600177 RepID=A0A5B8XVU4_9DELT|nr:CRISPR-associated endonuclease Cas1 [Microvenator marinus]QED29317.1 CRISPR-associated endonuclease Cas1 [Microvenator marinus]